MKSDILVLLAKNVEEIELVTPIDLWRRAGYHVTIASIDNNLIQKGQQGIVFQADCTLDEIDHRNFEYLYIPGGAGYLEIKNSKRAMSVIENFINKKKIICAICAAPTILSPWLQNIKATCYPSMKEQIPNWADQPVSVDQNIITAQGAGVSHLLALELIKLIDNSDKALEIKTKTIF